LVKDKARRQAIMAKLARLIGEKMEARGATLHHSPFAKQRRLKMTDRFTEFARDALAQMGCEALEALLRKAPLTNYPEELKLRGACWAAIARHCRSPADHSLAGTV